MTAAVLLTGLAVWAVALLPVATTIGRIPHTDRNRDSEESEAQPIGETGHISFFHVVGDTDV